jgi:hypothetical protein
MSRSSAARLAAAAMAFGVVAGSALVLGGNTANAAAASAAKSQTVKYSCKIPVLGTKVVATKLTISVPAKASAGSTVKIGLVLQPSGLPAVTITDVTVKSVLTVSGAQKGTVDLSAHFASGNSGSLKVDLAGKLKLTKSGTVHLSAGSSATFALTNSILGKTTLVCASSGKLPVLGSITVGKAGKAITGAGVADER